jgi:hypothetical protein
MSSTAFGYVFLGPHKPRIVVGDERTHSFYLTEKAPFFLDKEIFENGFYAKNTDEELFALLVQRSMNYWNEIPGLSIRLKVAQERDGIIDSGDNRFSIGVGTISTVASGLAYPLQDENNPSRLRDCDIQVGTDIDSIPSFIYVMVHELGHCLGLGHNHSDPSALMGYWQPRKEVLLGLDDMAGALSLYPPKDGEKTQRFVPCGNLAQVPQSFEEQQGRPPQSHFSKHLIAFILCMPFIAAVASRMFKDFKKT